MDCYICNSEMEYMGTEEIKILGGKCKKYKCKKCGEIVYEPLNVR